MPTITFVKEKKTIEVEDGANLRQAAMRAGVEVYPGIHKYPGLHCPGWGMCTTCKVQIKKGIENVSSQGTWEKMNVQNMVLHPFTYLARLGRENEIRLSCQTEVHGDIEVETQPSIDLHGERFWG